MKETSSIEKIKSELIKSCINYEPKSFIPFLLSEHVKTGMPNKMRFYNFFKQMLISTEKNSKGILKVKLKENGKNENYYLNFYDQIHENSRLTFEINENKENIYIDTLPF
jgi:hypothetical protein